MTKLETTFNFLNVIRQIKPTGNRFRTFRCFLVKIYAIFYHCITQGIAYPFIYYRKKMANYMSVSRDILKLNGEEDLLDKQQ